MGDVLDVLLNILLLGSLAIYVVVLIRVVLQTSDSTERFIRVTALFCGAMIVVGAQAAGSGYAEFIVDSLASARPGAALLAVVIPGLAGLAIGAYIIHAMKHRGELVAMRLLAVVGMLAAASFATIYAVAMREEDGHLGAAAVPNIAFVVGIILYVIMNYGTKPARRSSGSRFRDRLADRVRGGDAPRGPDGDSATGTTRAQPSVGGLEELKAAQKRAVRSDPGS